MFKEWNVVKKMSAILMAAIVCATSAMSGYAAESFENGGFDKTKEGEFVVDSKYDEIYSKIKAGRVATSTDAIPTDADAILKDDNGYIISGKWECSNGIIVELADNVFTFSGTGELDIDMKKIIATTIYKGSNHKIKCVINSGITRIGSTAFSGCSNLSSIEIPSGVTIIGSSAFSGCSSLSSIEIPNSVSKIEACAFYGCSSLSSIEIPSSVSKIEYRVFNDCSNLSSIKVAEDNTIYDSRENCNAIIETQTNKLIIGSNNTKIPNSVSIIGESAFNGYSNLNSIKIPSSVSKIDYLAFSGCTSLSNVEISDGVKSIGSNAFYGCSSLSSIEIPNSVHSIGRLAFSRCSSLSSIEIPSSVSTIETDVFSKCSSLTKITNHSSQNLILLASINNHDNGYWYLENTDKIIQSIANGQTAVYRANVQYGDINADGSINIQDGVILKKHLAGIKGLNVDIIASDVNADGEINIQDAVILMKHLAGMNVTMGK